MRTIKIKTRTFVLLIPFWAAIISPVQAEAVRISIVKPNAGVYLGPKIIAKAQMGQEFMSMEKRGTWYSISVMVKGERKVGWIKTSDVLVVERKMESLPAQLPAGLRQADGKIASIKDGAVIVYIPAGKFIMGDRRALLLGKVKKMTLPDFFIDVYEVTNAQYTQFVKATGHKKPPYADNKDMYKPRQPIVGVSYADADAYARWAGRRLPTSEEWEKAARGINGFAFPWGKDPATTDHTVIGLKLGEGSPQTVGSKPLDKSPFGVFDMAGNVKEWTSTATGIGRRTVRGAAWAYSVKKASLNLAYNTPESKADGLIGFRCAVSGQ